MIVPKLVFGCLRPLGLEVFWQLVVSASLRILHSPTTNLLVISIPPPLVFIPATMSLLFWWFYQTFIESLMGLIRLMYGPIIARPRFRLTWIERCLNESKYSMPWVCFFSIGNVLKWILFHWKHLILVNLDSKIRLIYKDAFKPNQKTANPDIVRICCFLVLFVGAKKVSLENRIHLHCCNLCRKVPCP